MRSFLVSIIHKYNVEMRVSGQFPFFLFSRLLKIACKRWLQRRLAFSRRVGAIVAQIDALVLHDAHSSGGT